MKSLIKEEIKPEVERQKNELKQVNLRIDYYETKLTQLEAHLPMMMQEIFEYYFEQKQAETKNKFITRDDLQKSLSFKLDTIRFTDFVGRH